MRAFKHIAPLDVVRSPLCGNSGSVAATVRIRNILRSPSERLPFRSGFDRMRVCVSIGTRRRGICRRRQINRRSQLIASGRSWSIGPSPPRGAAQTRAACADHRAIPLETSLQNRFTGVFLSNTKWRIGGETTSHVQTRCTGLGPAGELTRASSRAERPSSRRTSASPWVR